MLAEVLIAHRSQLAISQTRPCRHQRLLLVAEDAMHARDPQAGQRPAGKYQAYRRRDRATHTRTGTVCHQRMGAWTLEEDSNGQSGSEPWPHLAGDRAETTDRHMIAPRVDHALPGNAASARRSAGHRWLQAAASSDVYGSSTGLMRVQGMATHMCEESILR